MQYLLMIYANAGQMATMSAEAARNMSEGFAAFTRDIVASGHFRGGERLQPPSSATTVRVQNGKALMTDGPFAETREQLAGYYVVEARDLDEATSIAARIPGGPGSGVEVRPIWSLDEEELRRFGRAS
jgi:hypothetical protein